MGIRLSFWYEPTAEQPRHWSKMSRRIECQAGRTMVGGFILLRIEPGKTKSGKWLSTAGRQCREREKEDSQPLRPPMGRPSTTLKRALRNLRFGKLPHKE